MYSDYRLQYKPILAFLPFGFRSVLAEVCKLRSARQDAPQAIANKAKSTRGNKPKGMQKSDKKSAYIPLLDYIELKCRIVDFDEVIDLVKIIELIFRLGGFESHTWGCVANLSNLRERTSHDA